MISTKAWKRLDPQIQQWLHQAADESSTFQRKLWKEKAAQSLKEAKADGVTIYEVDQSLFAEKVKPMYDNIENANVRNLVTRIREVHP